MSAFQQASETEIATQYYARTAKGVPWINNQKGYELFTPREGENSIRIVPPLAEDNDMTLWGRDLWDTFLGTSSVLSPRTFDPTAEDPLYNYYEAHKHTDPESAARCKPRKRVFLYVIDNNDARDTAGGIKVKIWLAPPTLINEIVSHTKERETGALRNPADPVTGKAVYFTRQGQKLQTRYGGVQFGTEDYPLGDDVAQKVMLLRDLLIVPTADEVRAKLEQYLQVQDADDTFQGGAPAQPATQVPGQAQTQVPGQAQTQVPAGARPAAGAVTQVPGVDGAAANESKVEEVRRKLQAAKEQQQARQ